jgi:hypothetical protein
MLPIELVNLNGKRKKLKKDELEFIVERSGNFAYLYCKVCEASYSYDLFEDDREAFMKIHNFYHKKAIEKGMK